MRLVGKDWFCGGTALMDEGDKGAGGAFRSVFLRTGHRKHHLHISMLINLSA